MSKRLQVVLQESELRKFRQAARRAGLTLSEWARQTLRSASREGDVGDAERKLAAIRRAAALGDTVPGVDIETMNEEIERGYVQGRG